MFQKNKTKEQEERFNELYEMYLEDSLPCAPNHTPIESVEHPLPREGGTDEDFLEWFE